MTHVFRTPAKRLDTRVVNVVTLVAYLTGFVFKTSPPCPALVNPQQETNPVRNKAQVCSFPVLTAATPEIGLLFVSITVLNVVTGVNEVPSPHCPLLLYPIQTTVPLVIKIQVWPPATSPPV